MAVLPIFNPELQRTATTAVFKEISTSFTNIFNSLRKGFLGGHLSVCVGGGADVMKTLKHSLLSLD